ncbi:MAG: glycoside hydrolase family 3 C-terminal domain-containing protein [Paludibacter sp.]|nr:glycoside hydrolase family 3 C-terminal domain-containing protein [Paludibacter sp.]
MKILNIFIFIISFLCIGMIANAQIVVPFTTAGTTTWTCPDGITSITVECWGGGGAGGTGKNSSATQTRPVKGGGGAGGGYAKKVVSVIPGTNYTVVVGAGGISAPDATVNGEASYFMDATTVKADGGPGGVFNTSPGIYKNVAGGIATATNTGDVVYVGGNGASTYGTVSSGGSGGGGSSAGTSSDGVSATTDISTAYLGAIAPTGGGNGGNGTLALNTAGSPGAAPGGGGGGGFARALSSTALGGNGGTGKVLISYDVVSPTVFASPAVFPVLTTFAGSVSSSKSTVITGLLLAGAPGNLTATAPTGFEVSIDNSTFSDLVSIPYTTDTLDATLLYVRLKSSLTVGNYNSENVTITGGGLASAFNIPCSGIVSGSYVWSGGITGDWQVADNWTPARTTPTSGDILTINNGAERSHTSPEFIPPVSYVQADERANDIVSKMTIDEKIQLISGYQAFYIKGFEQYGIPQLYLSDASQGVHIRNNSIEKSTAFPCPIALASTWNPMLANKYAASIGEECRAGDIAVLLGPGMNIYRIAQSGRNFEYMGEDPFLTSRMVENYVVGMENTGTMATLKHFAANNTEFYRRRSNSVVDERTLHEIYLPAFKAGIDAGAMAVMTSYNQLNGEWCGQSSYVINQLLRKDLGFKGLVMSDWTSVWDAKKIILSGQDLEMPGNQNITKDALSLLNANEIAASDINRMAKSIIRTCISMGLYDRPIKDESYAAKLSGHKEVALQTAREAIVLLKNQNNILPITGDTVKTILLTGDYVDNLASGGGSAAVTGYDIVTMLNALQNEFGTKLVYAKTPTDEQIRSADVILLSVGTFDRENFDRPFSLPAEKDNKILDMAAKNKNLVVIVSSGSGIRMTNWNDKVAAIVYSWYPGQNGNTALAEILSGKINPSGKLPITIESNFEDSPGYGYIPVGKELYTTMPEDENLRIDELYDINYTEGIFVGYRWYESKNIAPLYPFGHGLSYTSFEYGEIIADSEAMSANDSITLSVKVKNTGKSDGAEIVQLYISDKVSSLPRPMKELKGFRKIYLKSGEEKTVTFTIDKKILNFYDPDKHAWVAEKGTFEAIVGASSTDIRRIITFELLTSDISATPPPLISDNFSYKLAGRILTPSQPVAISLYNALGIKVFEKNVQNEVEIPASLGKGVFFVVSKSGSQKIFLN